MIGWLLDTNVISTIINPNGAPTVKAWAAAQHETRFFLSILTLGEYDKGIADYDELIRLDPKHAKAYSGRGAAWAGKRDFDKAITDLSARHACGALRRADPVGGRCCRTTMGHNFGNGEAGDRSLAAGDRHVVCRKRAGA